ncbi:hypothetical protein FVE85_6265 [Porphyridium purpureum]|uniref:Transmembrane protein n=1 Tax=Porphyridium purpureum TaxID=35688 RepID=A0A5J4Z613_PORPP|nr:hypothetical protein FVE85_6265 [Porphyridium purpureum]|eukprot:POR9877..scf295_1
MASRSASSHRHFMDNETGQLCLRGDERRVDCLDGERRGHFKIIRDASLENEQQCQLQGVRLPKQRGLAFLTLSALHVFCAGGLVFVEGEQWMRWAGPGGLTIYCIGMIVAMTRVDVGQLRVAESAQVVATCIYLIVLLALGLTVMRDHHPLVAAFLNMCDSIMSCPLAPSSYMALFLALQGGLLLVFWASSRPRMEQGSHPLDVQQTGAAPEDILEQRMKALALNDSFESD